MLMVSKWSTIWKGDGAYFLHELSYFGHRGEIKSATHVTATHVTATHVTATHVNLRSSLYNFFYNDYFLAYFGDGMQILCLWLRD